MLRAHTSAYTCIKEIQPQAQVGLVVVVIIYDPPNPWNLLDVVFNRILRKNMGDSHFKYLVDGRFNFSIPRVVHESYDSGIKDDFDFVGVNYYMRFRWKLRLFGKQKLDIIDNLPPEKKTDMGWEIYPEGLYHALKLASSYTR